MILSDSFHKWCEIDWATRLRRLLSFFRVVSLIIRNNVVTMYMYGIYDENIYYYICCLFILQFSDKVFYKSIKS